MFQILTNCYRSSFRYLFVSYGLEATRNGEPVRNLTVTIFAGCRFCADVPLVASDRVELVKENDKHTLIIKKVVKAEEGIINVKATNEVGQMSASARLKVAGIQY